MTPDVLLPALEWAWCAETAMGAWDEQMRSLNQCAVTALVIQDYLGGDLLRCEIDDGDSHYWNKLPSGQELDLTATQFEITEAQPKRETVIVRDRAYVLSFPDTVRRYELLSSQVKKRLEGYA